MHKCVADGRKQPTIRTMLKPVMNLFHGERRGKKWKSLLDQELKNAASLSDLFDRTLPILPDDVLDQPPNEQLGDNPIAFATGQLPPPAEL